MKLLDLLVGRRWAEGATHGVQDGDGEVLWLPGEPIPPSSSTDFITAPDEFGNWWCLDDGKPCEAWRVAVHSEVIKLADDRSSAIVTKEQWMEAKEAASTEAQDLGGRPLTTIEALEHALANLKAGMRWNFGLEYADVGRPVPDGAQLSIVGGKYRHPKKVVINGYTVQAPISYRPKWGQAVGVEDPFKDDFAVCANWEGSPSQMLLLRRGAIHATTEDAAKACKARYGINPDSPND